MEELQEALKRFSIDYARFASHSARIGKATEDLIEDVPAEQFAISGRWKRLTLCDITKMVMHVF